MDHYKYCVMIDGEEIFFGFDGKTISLWGGSYQITFHNRISLEEAKEDIKKNYKEYKEDDLISFYNANGFYD